MFFLHSSRSHQTLSFVRLSLLLSFTVLCSPTSSSNGLTSRSGQPEIQEDAPQRVFPTCLSNFRFNLHWPDEGLRGQDRYYHRSDYRRLSEICLPVLPNGRVNRKPNFDCSCDEIGDVVCANGAIGPDLAFYCHSGYDGGGCDCPKIKRHRPKWLKIAMTPFEKRWQRLRAAKRNRRAGASSGVQEIGMPTIGGSNAASSSRPTCAANCLGFTGCDATRDQDGCEDAVCVSRRRRNSAGDRIIVGGCASLTTISGKRDLDQTACLCNQTYVSEKCCWEESGLVYEDSAGLLGDLRY